MIIVDMFATCTYVTPIASKSEGGILAGSMEGFNKMGGNPETAYTDDEPSLSSKRTQQSFNENPPDI